MNEDENDWKFVNIFYFCSLEKKNEFKLSWELLGDRLAHPRNKILDVIKIITMLLLLFAIYDSISKTFDTGDFNNDIFWILSEEVFNELNIAFTMCRFAFKNETKEISLTTEKLSVWQQNGFLFQWTVFKFHFSTRNWLINATFSKKWVLYMHFFFTKNTFVQQLVSFK